MFCSLVILTKPGQLHKSCSSASHALVLKPSKLFIGIMSTHRQDAIMTCGLAKQHVTLGQAFHAHN